MKDLKFHVSELKNSFVDAELNSKLNTIITIIGEEMDRGEEYKSLLDKQNKPMESYIVKEHINHNYVVMAVLNSILKDVDAIEEEIKNEFVNAMEQIEKCASDVSLATESDNA
ncbi:hypothetical protein [Staphylococcus warneri]|uniref:hypothetical protein n=2 Tax=Staphylococcus warneri TaxID=1292 RepID=UPI0002DF131C|nr:hypothetical protein [Staphylococcus warneri]MBC3133451.1 hypothetical protein [Staphylococcus warneri]MBF0768975.1 hypothetical protein [Staphylococcus warneri]MCE4999948.1 hypothetical protein [Staphylococcus warneri]TFU66778.1 hypothetical protein E4T90_04410 [Staphylococcus warneri]